MATEPGDDPHGHAYRWGARKAKERLTTWWAYVLATLIGGAVGALLVPSAGASPSQRLATGTGAAVATIALLTLSILLYSFARAPIEQRRALQSLLEEANDQIGRLTKQLTELTTPRFHVRAYTESLGHRHINEHRWLDVTVLWVDVQNDGAEQGRFTASIPALSRNHVRKHSGPPLEADYGVSSCAWEGTTQGEISIAGHGHVARLMLAYVGIYQGSTCIVFLTSETAAWNPRSHGVGFYLRPIHHNLRVPLLVTDTTHSTSRTVEFELTFTPTGTDLVFTSFHTYVHPPR